jgi:hypothetical protein
MIKTLIVPEIIARIDIKLKIFYTAKETIPE